MSEPEHLNEASEGASGPAETQAGTVRIPPYIPFPTLLTFLHELKTNGMPPQIDGSVLRRFSGGVQSQLKMAVRSLGLMEGAKPTPFLQNLVSAYETPNFEPLLLELLKANYPYVFALDLMTATPQMFADAFKATGAKDDVARKCRTFFLHAAKRAGVPLGQRILTGSVPRGPSNGTTRKKAKATKATPETPAEESIVPHKPPKTDLGKEHPLVQGLLMTLPTPGKAWTIDQRASWLRMASSIFENIYQGKGTIEVKVVGPAKETAADQ
jgi:hypothetical protein